VSWQVTPRRLLELVTDRDPARARAAMQAMLGMGRIDIAALEVAAGSAAAA
jgi:predicted 3-demethylubiquinone-9 3-methyltransferase (glyoxalase superfamily)